MYYFNAITKTSSWEKPAELMTDLERAGAICGGICAATLTNYYNCNATVVDRFRNVPSAGLSSTCSDARCTPICVRSCLCLRRHDYALARI